MTAVFVCWTTERRTPADLGPLLIGREMHARIHGHRCSVVDVEPMSDGSVRVVGVEAATIYARHKHHAQTFRLDERVTIHRPIYEGDHVSFVFGSGIVLGLADVAVPSGVIVRYEADGMTTTCTAQPDDLALVAS